MVKEISEEPEKDRGIGENGLSVSKRTIKRILLSLNMSWRRIRKKPKGVPDPVEYSKKKAELEELEVQADK